MSDAHSGAGEDTAKHFRDREGFGEHATQSTDDLPVRMQKFKIGGGHMLMIGLLFLLAATCITGVMVSASCPPNCDPPCCPDVCTYDCPFATVEEGEGVDPVVDKKEERVAPSAHRP